ncbi:MAG: response regulator [Ferruginibacter sp.]
MKYKLNCILVIDDDEATNFFTRIILEEAGCAQYIKMVESGKEALAYLLTSHKNGCDENYYPCPDLILLDINMPAMDGWEFLEEYKKLDKEIQGKVMTVMLTTSLFPEDRERAESMPEISGFENKPITIGKLERILQKHFSRDDSTGKLAFVGDKSN